MPPIAMRIRPRIKRPTPKYVTYKKDILLNITSSNFICKIIPETMKTNTHVRKP